MEGPSLVRLLRKRNEEPVDTLFLQRPAPHFNPDDEGKLKLEHSGPTTYIRQVKRKQEPEEDDGNAKKRQLRASDFHGDATTASNELGQGLTQPIKATPRKEYLLKHPSSSSPATQTRSPRKRKQDNDVATFVERKDLKKHRAHGSDASNQQHEYSADLKPEPEVAQNRPFKKPGRNSALKSTHGMDIDQPKHETPIESQRRIMEALADEMHKFALDELAKTPKPQVTSRPKLPAARSRARHQQLASATPVTHPTVPDTDVDMDSDSEYVYDTYVLATPSASKPANPSDPTDVLRVRDVEGNVGYLVITEADEEAWETYMDEHDGEDPEATDEEDENAEDYYGADYPSDELASDDEYDCGAYGYRAHAGSDDEQYDQDTGAWSDGYNDEDSYAAKGRMPGNFERFLAERRSGDVGDDE